MKQCTCCGVSKSETEFYVRKAGTRAGELYNHCRDCLRKRGRQYYSDHREVQAKLALQRRRTYRISRKQYIIQLKDKPCADCGQKYPHYVMDFDHRDGVIKRGSLANLVNQSFLSFADLQIEVDKCDLVCANCHRIRTFTRLSKINTLE